MRRVLITGSRDWPDPRAVHRAIFDQYLETQVGEEFTVVHGDCPTGADRFARDFCERPGIRERITQERHPADWERTCDENCYHKPRTKNGKPYCPMAGHLRNQTMADLGADVCLAFPLPNSRGTVDCMRRARAAGIPIIEHEMVAS